MGIFDIFKSKPKFSAEPDRSMRVDFHSHLLPGIDDGCKTINDSLENIRELQNQGVKRIITTPHIFNELYPNTPEIIREKLALLKKALVENNINIEIEAAAEYYLDEWFCQNYESMELLTLSGNHILVETNYMDRPHFLEQIFFDLQTSGYKVIFAHPERYNYLLNNYNAFHKLHDSGILFQCNLLSFTGYYSPQIKKAAEYLLKHKMIHMVGSDIHKIKHTQTITHLKKSQTYQELLKLDLLNNSL